MQTNPFGFSFNQNDVSPTKEVADTTTTTPPTHGAAGSSAVAVSASLTGLSGHTTYHFRAVATVFGKRYVVQRASSLTTPDWTTLSATLNGNGTPLSYTDANSLANGGDLFSTGCGSRRESCPGSRSHRSQPGRRITKLSRSASLHPWLVGGRSRRCQPSLLLLPAWCLVFNLGWVPLPS